MLAATPIDFARCHMRTSRVSLKSASRQKDITFNGDSENLVPRKCP